jgi:hypothetical protein
MSANSGDSWRDLNDSVTAFERRLSRITAVNINTAAAREEAKALVQDYFRLTRPDLSALGIGEAELAGLDEPMQYLLQLSAGRNSKKYYSRALRDVRAGLQALELTREYRLGETRRAQAGRAGAFTHVETRIVSTLKDLVPTAALSYEQALRDLAASDERVSFRGTANELREALRETVDRLAPDDEVIGAPNFKLERGQAGPTQKQKVRHILRSRALAQTARRAPEASIELIEGLVGSVARASYERSSLSAHISSTHNEVRQLKMYVDSVLAELLQVHS